MGAETKTRAMASRLDVVALQLREISGRMEDLATSLACATRTKAHLDEPLTFHSYGTGINDLLVAQMAALEAVAKEFQDLYPPPG